MGWLLGVAATDKACSLARTLGGQWRLGRKDPQGHRRASAASKRTTGKALDHAQIIP